MIFKKDQIQESKIETDITKYINESGLNPLHLAVSKNSFDIVKMLCEHIVKVNGLKSESDNVSMTQITPIESLQRCINEQTKADISYSCMHLAAYNGSIKMIEYL